MQDVTDQHRVQTRLRENNDRLEMVTANLPGLLYQCRCDDAWTLEYVSNGCRELTGYDPEDLMSSPRWSFDRIVHPDDRPSEWLP